MGHLTRIANAVAQTHVSEVIPGEPAQSHPPSCLPAQALSVGCEQQTSPARPAPTLSLCSGCPGTLLDSHQGPCQVVWP